MTLERKVLFVDDEPHVLEGLRHRLHRLRKSWNMTFAESGTAALEVLAREPVDVIITDMRMPQMDGATLLKHVQELYPHVVRIVLSGHAELETALRAVPVAHQFLSKPSEPGVIENVVERACSLQSLINDDVVKRTVGKIEKLPSLPRVYSELVAALSNENASIEDVARILKQDVAISAKTLQVVNSAFFRLPRSIGKIEEAVHYLGLNTVRHVVLAVEVFHQDKRPSRAGTATSLEALQQHSMSVGQVATLFFADRQQKEDAFVAGLLHDIGKLLLAVELPDYPRKVVAGMKDWDCSMSDAEERILGVTHAEVGAYLLGLWGLPYPVIEAVANHHKPARVQSQDFGILSATHLADRFVHDEVDGEIAGPLLDLAHLESVGVVDKLEGWKQDAKLELRKCTG